MQKVFRVRPAASGPLPKARQRGVSLLFALIAMVALALAAVALSRSVNTGALIVGNLGFKKDALLAGDQAAEQALAWIQANVADSTLFADSPAQGYYASAMEALDPTGNQTGVANRAVVDWNMDNCASVSGGHGSCLRPSDPVTVNGNTSRYVITRLCAATGNPTASGTTCASPLIGATSDDQNRSGYDYSRPTGFGQTVVSIFYRIIVRTVGPRGTTTYTETIVQT